MTVNGSIREASLEAIEALDSARRERDEAAQRLRTLRGIDRVLEALEEINLSGLGFEPVTDESIAAMERVTDAQLPQAVRGATTPVDLHEALLDWQEQLLDTAVPARVEFREVDAEIDPPEPRRRRRRRRRPSVVLRSAA